MVLLLRGTPLAANASELLVRVQHLFTAGEDAILSRPVSVDILKLVAGARPDVSSMQETTLDGMRDVTTLHKLRVKQGQHRHASDRFLDFGNKFITSISGT